MLPNTTYQHTDTLQFHNLQSHLMHPYCQLYFSLYFTQSYTVLGDSMDLQQVNLQRKLVLDLIQQDRNQHTYLSHLIHLWIPPATARNLIIPTLPTVQLCGDICSFTRRKHFPFDPYLRRTYSISADCTSMLCLVLCLVWFC